jgi:hypothetical protein
MGGWDRLALVSGWGLGLTRLGVLVSVPAVNGTPLRSVSCGFAALTLDCRSFDQELAGYRVRPRCGARGSALGGREQLW